MATLIPAADDKSISIVVSGVGQITVHDTGQVQVGSPPLNLPSVRNMVVSTANPSGGVNGDVWFKI